MFGVTLKYLKNDA